MNLYMAPALAALALVGLVIVSVNNTLDDAGRRGQPALEGHVIAMLVAFGLFTLIVSFCKTPRWVTLATSVATIGVGLAAFMLGTARLD